MSLSKKLAFGALHRSSTPNAASVYRGPDPARDLCFQKFTDAETRAVRGAPWNR